MPFWPVWKRAGTPSPSRAPHSGARAGWSGETVLQAGVELEPLDAVLLDEHAGPSDGVRPLVRVDRAEGDQYVGVLGGLFGDLLAAQRRVAGSSGRVDGEDDRRHVDRAVAGREVRDGRGAVLRALEVARGGVQQLVVEGEVAVPVGLYVHVDVDRRDGVDVDAWLVAGHSALAFNRDLMSLPDSLCGSSSVKTSDLGGL